MDAGAVPTVLADRLGPEATGELIELFAVAERECVEQVMARSVERFERRLTEEISLLRIEMVRGDSALREEIGHLRVEMHQEMTGLRQEMASQKFDLLKWSFLFWIGQVVAIATLLRISGR